jgi:hypothetical protein
MDYITAIINRYEAELQKVKNDAYCIQFVKEQTNELCLIALEKEPWCFQHVITMSKEMWRLAVKKDGRILHQIKDIELKLQLTREITNELNLK